MCAHVLLERILIVFRILELIVSEKEECEKIKALPFRTAAKLMSGSRGIWLIKSRCVFTSNLLEEKIPIPGQGMIHQGKPLKGASYHAW